MPQPRFEVATGLIDGLNVTFKVSVAYTPVTLAVFVNGALRKADAPNGWIESVPATGFFEMRSPPVAGDVIQAFFIDRSAVLPGQEITPMKGVLVESSALSGKLSEFQALKGKVEV